MSGYLDYKAYLVDDFLEIYLNKYYPIWYTINLRLYILLQKICIDLLLSPHAGKTPPFVNKPQSLLCVSTVELWTLFALAGFLSWNTILSYWILLPCLLLSAYLSRSIFHDRRTWGYYQGTHKSPISVLYEQNHLFIHIDESYPGLEIKSSRMYVRMGTTFTHESKAWTYFKDAIARTRSQGLHKETQARPGIFSPVSPLLKPSSLVSKESNLVLWSCFPIM